MKPSIIPVEHIAALPLLMRVEIPPAYQDENGHMNVRYYMVLFDDAGYPLVERIGLTPEFHAQNRSGGFDLEHHLHYLNEVHIGDTVEIYVRMLGRTAKRMHYMMFMVNATRGKLAATFECVNSFADLAQRKTAPYPLEIAEKIDTLLNAHQSLTWNAPTCSVMGA